jgi:hypothetical protein
MDEAAAAGAGRPHFISARGARAIRGGVDGIAVPADDPRAEFNTHAELLQQTRGLSPLAAGRGVCQEHLELVARCGLTAQGDVAK